MIVLTTCSRCQQPIPPGATNFPYWVTEGEDLGVADCCSQCMGIWFNQLVRENSELRDQVKELENEVKELENELYDYRMSNGR